MKKISRFAALLAAAGAPFFASAQTGINLNAITPYSNGITYVINGILVPVLMAIAFIVFLWGIYQYFIQGAANEESRKTGRQFTLWGIIGFVVILSLWGIVNIFMGALGLSVGSAPPFPTIGTGSYTPGAGGNSNLFPGPGTGTGSGGGTVTSAQSAALTQQTTSMTTICSQSGPASSACQQAQAAYSRDYCALYPSQAVCNISAGSVNPGGACIDPNNCTSGYTCDVANHTCVEIGSVGSVGQGGYCTDTGNCAGGYMCTNNTCVLIGSGGGYSSGTVPLGGDCTNAACDTGLTCGPNYLCEAAPYSSGTVPLGGDCTNASCATGLTCGPNYLCEASGGTGGGNTSGGAAPGAYCFASTDCASGVCDGATETCQ